MGGDWVPSGGRDENLAIVFLVALVFVIVSTPIIAAIALILAIAK